MSTATSTLLVVDDEPNLLRLLSTGFRRSGYAVIEASTGAECLEALAAHDIDLVLLDSGLPDIIGPEVIRQVRADPRHGPLPILMVTGHAEISERVDGLRAGANDYVTKPVVFAELLARVEATLREQTTWKARLRERISVHGRLVTEVATAFESDEPLWEVARAIRESLVFRQLVIAESAGGGPVLVRAASPPPSSGGHSRQVIDGGHVLTSEIHRLVGAGASLMHNDSARLVYGPNAGPSVLLSVESSGGTVLALIAELDPSVRSSNMHVREAIASLTDLAGVIESTAGNYLQSDVSIIRSQILELVDRREFHPVFQPICRLDDAAVIGYEQLTRFDDRVAPDVRFAQAHRAGVGLELEFATLQLGLEHASALPLEHMVSINVSPSLIDNPGLLEILDRCADRPISLELTENERIADYDRVLEAISRLPDSVHLSVDDAGSGWASLWHVHRLRPEFVKIDRSWVHGLHADPGRQILLRGLQLFVEEVGGRIIAEGIEDTADLAPLRVAGVSLAQGYLFGRPAPIEHWLGGSADGARSTEV